MHRGKFIAIYGVNNIGKSTHTKILIKKLREAGHEVEYLKYPIYKQEPTGPFLNSVLREGQKIAEDALQMWFVLNRYQYEMELERMLDLGKIVVAEDYVGTGIAWGVAKGVDEDWLEGINKKLLVEDFSLLMEGQRHQGSKEKGHLHEQNEELLVKCEKVLSDLADKKGWTRIRVQKRVDDTAALLWEKVESFLIDQGLSKG